MPARPLPRALLLRVRGTRNATRKARAAEVLLDIDLSTASEGEMSVEYANHAPILPPGVELIATSPPAEQFTLDSVISKKVEVDPVLVGDPAGGYAVEDVQIDPPVIEVRGPRVTLERLTRVVTSPIDISGLDGRAEIATSLDLPRQVSTSIPDARLMAKVSVAPLLERRILGSVPVHVWRQHGWRPVQETVEVTVEGPAAALRGNAAEQVVAFVHLPDEPERDTYEAPFGPEEGVRLRVMHPGGAQVHVVKVDPGIVEVVRP